MTNSPNLPYVICHMMMTIDGKIHSGTAVDVFGDYFSLYTKTEATLEGNAWMCGRKTMEMFAQGINTPLAAVEGNMEIGDYLPSTENKKYMFAVDTQGVLRWKSNTIKLTNVEGEVHLAVVVTEATPKEYLAYLKEKQIAYIVAGEVLVDFEKLMDKVRGKFGVKKLLLEGGGFLNGSALFANYVDELSLLVVPIAINRSAALSLFENDNPDIDLQKFSLTEVKQIEKEVVWLRYKKQL